MEFHIFIRLIFNGCGKDRKGSSLLPNLKTAYKTTRKAQFWRGMSIARIPHVCDVCHWHFKGIWKRLFSGGIEGVGCSTGI